MATETKDCNNCKHHQMLFGANSFCNLYNKYTVGARILCGMQCWQKIPKQKKVTK